MNQAAIAAQGLSDAQAKLIELLAKETTINGLKDQALSYAGEAQSAE